MILAVGQFIYRKGFDTLIKSAAYVPKNVGFYLVGGEPIDEYRKIIDQEKLENIHFVDFQNTESLEHYYKAADMFVLPTREDIWGLVINEAIAYGLPIITTTTCVAGSELVKNNGLIIDPDDPEQLAAAIEKLLKSDLSNLATNSIRIARNYTIEKMALFHKQIIEEQTETN